MLSQEKKQLAKRLVHIKPRRCDGKKNLQRLIKERKAPATITTNTKGTYSKSIERCFLDVQKSINFCVSYCKTIKFGEIDFCRY